MVGSLAPEHHEYEHEHLDALHLLDWPSVAT